MPRKDKYHDSVKNALVKEGWTITNDPFRIVAGTQDVYIDLAAERLIAAERIGETGEIERIAVEIKSFRGLSSVADLEQAIGQYLLYRGVIKRTEPERILYLAVAKRIYDTVFSTVLGKIATEDYGVRILACDMDKEEVTLWT